MKWYSILVAAVLIRLGTSQEVSTDPSLSLDVPPAIPLDVPPAAEAPNPPPTEQVDIDDTVGGEAYELDSHSFQVVYKDPIDIASVIAGNGVTVKSLVYYGAGVQRGLFSNGYDAIGFDNGAIFSTGDIKQAMDGQDDSDLQQPGYYPLSKLIPVGETRDASVLRVVFKCPTNKKKVSVKYVFGSNEYPSNGGTDPEDVMAMFLNGKNAAQNIAIVNGKYVSTSTLRGGPNFIDNLDRHRHVQVDGFTVPLRTLVRAGKSGWNELRIAIADGGNNNYKGTSFLFIPEDGMVCAS